MIQWFEKDELNFLDDKGKELRLQERLLKIPKFLFWMKRLLHWIHEVKKKFRKLWKLR